MRRQALLDPFLDTLLQMFQKVHLLMNRLLRFIDDPAEGTEHPLKPESGNSSQRVEGRIDIFIFSQISQMATDKEVPGEEPFLVWFVKADMVIGMPWRWNHQKTEF